MIVALQSQCTRHVITLADKFKHQRNNEQPLHANLPDYQWRQNLKDGAIERAHVHSVSRDLMADIDRVTKRGGSSAGGLLAWGGLLIRHTAGAASVRACIWIGISSACSWLYYFDKRTIDAVVSCCRSRTSLACRQENWWPGVADVTGC